MIKNIVEFDDGEFFLEVNNSVGQRWYFPYKGIGQYLSIFRPSSIAGKAVRCTIPFIKHFTFIHSFLKMKRVQMNLNADIRKEISNTFNSNDWGYSIFCGSPGRHQKMTILVRDKANILGYCKISDNFEVVEIFRKENEALNYLHKMDVKMIPEVLLCKRMNNIPNTWIYIQSTKEKKSSHSPTIYSKEVHYFLTNLKKRTNITIYYEETEYHTAINNLKNRHIMLFDEKSQAILSRAINDVETIMKRTENTYTFSHGDFTPWNCFIVDKKLFAFDFEYCKRTYPLYYDLFHFYTQSCMYDKFWDERKIYKKYKKLKEKVFGKLVPTDTCNFYYKCYLLGIIEFYLTRDNGVLNKRIEYCFRIWIGLINKLSNE